MSKTPIRFVATTVPGFGGTAPPEDLSMESYSKLAGQLASDLGCDAVVGHSLGANIALEMASAGEFSGPLVLLSPSFSRRGESRFPRALDRLSRVLGHLPYSLMLKIIGPAMKSGLPPTRREALIAELKNNEPRFLRRQTHLSNTSTATARSPRVLSIRAYRRGSCTARATTSESPTTSETCSKRALT
jgi:pimeloyl-ACP methyl ester carboxylesterase